MALLALSATNTWSTQDEDAAILMIGQRLAKQFHAGATASMLSFYTTDAIMLPPSSEILSNPEDISGYWELLKSAGVKEYAIYPVALRVDGNTAYQTALWEATRYTPDGDKIHLEGNISNILEKQGDASWKIKLQSWN